MSMKYIDIFLASSIDELHEARLELGNYVRELNDRFVGHEIYFRLHMCEAMSDEIAETRKQDEYNAVIESCDYFYILVWQKLGKYTREEFDVAFRRFKENHSPRISTFFLETDGKVGDDVRRFMAELDENLQHYYTKFSDIDTVKLKMLLQLSARVDSGAKLELKDSRLTVDGSPLHSICLEKLPFYCNHATVGKLKEELAALGDDLAAASAAFAACPTDTEALRRLTETGAKRQNALDRLHEIEKQLLDVSAQLAVASEDGVVSQRMRTAIRLLESGHPQEALLVLNVDEMKRETARSEENIAREQANLAKRVQEWILRVGVLKTMERTSENLEQIHEAYGEACRLVRTHGLDYACVLDYVWFMREQKTYTPAAELAEAMCRELSARKDIAPGFWADVCYYVGVLYRDMTRPGDAERLLKEALAIRRELAAKEPDRYEADVASSCNSLGILYRISDRMEEAEPIYREGLEILRRLSEKNLILYGGERANLCNNLGYMHFRTGDFARAEELFSEALDVRTQLESREAEKHTIYLGRIHNNLGDLYCAQGRMEEAEQNLLRGLALRQACVKQDPVNRAFVAGSHASLGILYSRLDRAEEAEHHLKEAIAVYELRAEESTEAYGSYLADNCTRLGALYAKTGRNAEAEALLDRALTLYRPLAARSSAEHSGGLADVCSELGELYLQTGRASAAERMLCEARALLDALMPKNPPFYAGAFTLVLDRTARAARLTGRTGEADRLRNEALACAERYAAVSGVCARYLATRDE